MVGWEQRPLELANLFNPAFCSILLHDSILAYQNENAQGMPYPVVFLILPIVLHKSTREKLPSKITTKMHVWVQNNPEVHIHFAEHTRYLIPYTKESLIFGMQANDILISDSGSVIAKKRKKNVINGFFI